MTDYMALIDAYAEARCKYGSHTYNTKTAEARKTVEDFFSALGAGGVERLRSPAASDAFAARYQADADDPACSEELAIYCAGWADADRAARAQAPAAVEPVAWREQFTAQVYADLAAADNQDVPLEDYPARILKVLDSIVGPRHPTVVQWRNDAIKACIEIVKRYGAGTTAYQERDMAALLYAAPTTKAEPAPIEMNAALRKFIEGMSVSVDVSTGDHDAYHRYFGKVTEVMDCHEDKHGVILLVQEPEPNFKAEPAPEVIGEKFQRAWVQLDELPGGMMDGTRGRFGPIPASCSAWITTSEKERDRCRAGGETMLEVWLTPQAAPAHALDAKALLTALQRAHDWMDSQADAQSKGCHSTFDLMMLREERDAAAAAIAAQAAQTKEGGAS